MVMVSTMEREPMTKKRVVLSSNKSLNNGTGGSPMANDENTNACYTREKLQEMSDKDLSFVESSLIRTISRLRKASEKTLDTEVELCYVQDEIFRRSRMSSYRTSKK